MTAQSCQLATGSHGASLSEDSEPELEHVTATGLRLPAAASRIRDSGYPVTVTVSARDT